MPTGYTAKIADGMTFKEFALGCARAFGALIEMRDDPMDAPIPDKFEPSTWNREQLTKAQEWLTALDAMDLAQAQKSADIEFDKEQSAYLKRCEERRVLRSKYEDMLNAAKSWQPPTPEHQGLQDFMIEQINRSIDGDCAEYPELAPKKLTGREWLDAQITQARWDIDYHTKKNEEEIARTNGRTEWVAQLRQSLV